MNSTEKRMNQSAIGCMVNTTINVNKVFRDQFEKFLKEIFHSSTMSGIKNILKKEDKFVIALVIFYENRTTSPMRVLRVLIFVLYSVKENYVCIDYLCCQYKRLRVIYSDKIFSDMSYNELLGIGIQKVLINLIACHGFMKKQNQLSYCYSVLSWWDNI